MGAFKHIHVSGTAYECGKQIGEQAKDNISANLEVYDSLFASFDITWSQAREIAVHYLPWIEQYDAQIMEEIHGIAAGSGIDLIDIVVLNARSEIMNHGGCTSLVALPPSTVNNKTILAQNWDWSVGAEDGTIVLEIAVENRPKILMCTEAGIVGKIGMNDAGLGVCLNFLSTSEKPIYGVPVHIVLRGILNSTLYSQAVGQVTRMDRGTSMNYVIATKEGEALNIEATSTNFDVIYPEEDILVHTNHFYGPKAANLLDLTGQTFPDTYFRNGRAMKLLRKAKVNGSIEMTNIKAILSDHVNYPDAICRHGSVLDPLPGREIISDTVFSILMNLTDGYFELSAGTPCNTPFEKYLFTENSN